MSNFAVHELYISILNSDFKNLSKINQLLYWSLSNTRSSEECQLMKKHPVHNLLLGLID